jgi:hypothetical protein
VASREESESGPRSEEQRLADRLAEYDEAMVEGREPAEELSVGDDSEQSRILEELQACVWLVRRVLPRHSQDGDSTARIDGSPRALELDEPPAAGSALPERFGRFRIVRELGRGGFGVVFLAVDPVLNREVALKVPQPGVLASPDGHRRWLREAQAAAALDHPNLVPVFEAGQFGLVSYLTSAYCEGENLSVWLRDRGGTLPVRQAARLVAMLADAVQHAHDRGILHRDLKPGNVLMQRQAGNGDEELEFLPRITDFGLAVLTEQPGDDTFSGLLIGSPPYMAPEQAAGRRHALSPKTDVYALGTILYELLTGRPPHCGETPLETIRQVTSEEPTAPREIRPSLPCDMQTVVLKCLAKEPECRYCSARALGDDLRRFLDDEPIQACRNGLLSQVRLWALNPRRIKDAGTLSMVFSGLLTAWCLVGIVLATLGVGLHPPRPDGYLASSIQVVTFDLLPVLFLGRQVRRGKVWALCIGTVFNVARVGFQVSCMNGGPPDFGGLYDDPRLRVAVYAFILLTTLSILLLHLVALASWLSRRQGA